MTPPRRLDDEESFDPKQFWSSYDTVLFDCDGVLWRDVHPIDGAKQLLDFLRDEGKHVVYVSNNSTRSRAEYRAKFLAKGIDHVDASQVFTSAYAAAAYLKRHTDAKKAFVIGQSGIHDELSEVGIVTVGHESHLNEQHELNVLSGWVADETIDCVVVGFDSKFNYSKMTMAQAILARPGTHFVATNTDHSFPVGEGRQLPGSGSIVSAVSVASARTPVVVGKPENTLLEVVVNDALGSVEWHPERTLMIGDRLETDILFGKRAGVHTLLVLSGVASASDLENTSDELRPTYVATSVLTLAV